MVSEKFSHILCTAIIGNLKYFILLKLLNTIMMVNIHKKYILQELRSSIFCFIFVNINDTYHWRVG